MRSARLAAAVATGALLAAACGGGSDPPPVTAPGEEPVGVPDDADDGPDDAPDDVADPPTPNGLDVAATAASGWSVTGVDTGIKPEVALDAAGVPAVAYLFENLPEGYVRFAAATDDWAHETVAEGYFYGPLDLAFDPDGRPNLVWHDHQDTSFRPELGNLAYAVRDAGGWQALVGEDDGHDGWDSTIAIAPDGTVHAAGVDPSQFGRQDGVEHYLLDGDEFVVTSIGSGPIQYEWNVSLAIGPDARPAMSYFNDRDESLVYASFDGSDWALETVTSAGDVGRFSSLAFDAEGRPHVTFLEVTGQLTGTVHYAVRDGGEWVVEAIAELSDVSTGMFGARRVTAVAIGPDGTPRAAFTDRSGLWYAVRGEGGWEVEEVLQAGDRPLGQQVSLAVDAAGTPHLATYEVTSLQPPLEGVILYATSAG